MNPLLPARFSSLNETASDKRDLLAVIDREIGALPSGRLVMNRKQDKTYFYRVIDGIRQSIRRDEETIYDLARKRYLIAGKHLIAASLNEAVSSRDSDQELTKSCPIGVLVEF